MQEKLVIYLHGNDLAHPSWAVITTTGEIRQSAMHDDPQGLTSIAENKLVIVVVPAEDVLLTSVQLPKMNRARLRQALPFALEEELVEDVDQLHFAIADEEINDHLPVAVIAKKKMQDLLDLCKEWQMEPDVFISASLSIPFIENSISVAIFENMAIVRAGVYQGFACDQHNLAHMLNEEFSSKHSSIVLKNYSQQSFSLLQAEEKIIPEAQFIIDIAKAINQYSLLNLLQNQYVVKKTKFLQIGKLSKVAMGLTAILFGLILLYPTVSYFILKQKLLIIDGKIFAIYKKQFPQATHLIAPKERMEEKLRHQGSGDNMKFLLLAGYVGSAMQQSADINLKRMDFQNNQLTLEIIAASPESFTTFNDQLVKQGLLVKQQNASLIDSKVNATLVVEK